MKKTIIYISLILIGVILGVSIMMIPRVRYDLNFNGRVDIADFLKYYYYYTKS